MKTPKPADRLGWHKYYVKQFNKTGSDACSHLAMWYLMLHLAFDNNEPTPHLTPVP